jgi:Rieske Fe-S protein
MIDRRTIVKGALALPLLAAAGGLTASFLPFLKPTQGVLEIPKPDQNESKELQIGLLSDLKQPFDSISFEFLLETKEYTERGKQVTRVPGYVVRVPNGVVDKEITGAKVTSAADIKKGYLVVDHAGETFSLVAISRICAHLGCIFEYHTPDEVCKSFNYCGEAVKGKDGHSLFSCPCHLSVYNPVLVGEGNGVKLPGLVVSGPAPRPPFPFDFRVDGDKIVIKSYT